MVMDFLTGIIEKFLGWVLTTLQSLFSKIDLSPFTEKFDYLINLVDCVNVIFPIKETLIILSILCMFAFYSLVFWCVQKLVEMIRG